jgi:hypothetical protein
MRHPRRDVEHVAFTHHDLLTIDEKAQATLEHVGDLLAFV